MKKKFILGRLAFISSKLLFIFICSFSFLNSFGQHNLENIIKEEPNMLGHLQKAFKKFSIHTLNGSAVYNEIKQGKLKQKDFSLNLGSDKIWNFKIEKNEIKTKNYIAQVKENNTIKIQPSSSILTFKGYLKDDPSTKIRLNALDSVLSAMVTFRGKTFFLESASNFSKMFPKDLYVLYEGSDVIDDHNAACASINVEEAIEDINKIQEELAVAATGCVITEIALAADYSFVSNQGGATGAEARIISILNMVNEFYRPAPLEIEYVISELFLSGSTSSDPWSTSTDATTLLSSFANWGNGGGFKNKFDVATLWTKRDISANGSSGVVGIARVGAVCTSNKYNIVEHYSSNIKAVAIDQAHELGHNWNASHSDGSTFIMNPSIGTSNDQWDPTTINSITNWKSRSSCFSPCGPKIPIAQFSANNTLSCNGSVIFTDESLNAPTSWSWDFGDGKTSVEKNPTHNYSDNGMYNVRLKVTNTEGQNEVIKNSYIQVDRIPTPILSATTASCEASTIDLSTSSPEGTVAQWYDAPNGGKLLNTGNTYSTTISNTTSVYVENTRTFLPQKLGAIGNQIGTGGYFTNNDLRGLLFDTFTPTKIKSAKVYANSAGERTIEIRKGIGGNIILSKVVNIPAGESRISLDFVLPHGSQYHLKVTGTLIDLYRNTAGGQYPYSISNLVSITETDAAPSSPNYYYYFYDWEVEKIGCSSVRTPVSLKANCATSTESENLSNNIQVFPNPTNSSFTLSFPASTSNIFSAEILNELGTKLITRSIDSNIEKTLEFNISNFPSGIYILILKSENSLISKKIVKH